MSDMKLETGLNSKEVSRLQHMVGKVQDRRV